MTGGIMLGNHDNDDDDDDDNDIDEEEEEEEDDNGFQVCAVWSAANKHGNDGNSATKHSPTTSGVHFIKYMSHQILCQLKNPR